MRADRWLVDVFIRTVTNIICRIDKRPLADFPVHGPLIVVTNHIGSIEVPLVFSHIHPRRVFGLAKVETWDNHLMGWLFDLWEAIPVRRGEADLDAIRRCLKVLSAGDILVVAPEGTRSRDGRLLRGQPGVVTLALRSGVPILPVAHWGIERLPENLKRLRRTDFTFKVGKPFYLTAGGARINSEVRQKMVDAIMCQLAALMPPAYHGAYADCKFPWTDFVQFA